jgi:hypothetical protein
LDPRDLASLMEEAQDTHVDAMKGVDECLEELVDEGQARRANGALDPDESAADDEKRRHLLNSGVGILSGTAFGAGLLAVLTAQSAAASGGMDVAAAQTAASLENVAIAVYNKAATLPFMANIPNPAGATIGAFVKMTVAQHTDHAAAFNAAATKLGGQPQTGVDEMVMTAVVQPALPTLKSPLDVVNFAATLELVAAETYAAQTAAVSDKNLRGTFASIMGVENQHRSILLAAAALLKGGAPQLITLGPPLDQLPAAAGAVGFPDSFLKTDQARPAMEGAVQ